MKKKIFLNKNIFNHDVQLYLKFKYKFIDIRNKWLNIFKIYLYNMLNSFNEYLNY